MSFRFAIVVLVWYVGVYVWLAVCLGGNSVVLINGILWFVEWFNLLLVCVYVYFVYLLFVFGLPVRLLFRMVGDFIGLFVLFGGLSCCLLISGVNSVVISFGFISLIVLRLFANLLYLWFGGFGCFGFCLIIVCWLCWFGLLILLFVSGLIVVDVWLLWLWFVSWILFSWCLDWIVCLFLFDYRLWLMWFGVYLLIWCDDWFVIDLLVVYLFWCYVVVLITNSIVFSFRLLVVCFLLLV